MNLFSDIYRSKRVLVTGHTGFKGSWLVLWLQKLGAEVSGIALPPETQPNHWTMLNLAIDDRRIDIRETEHLQLAIQEIQPDIVFHLAAQPLVRRSYHNPLETWTTNVIGTANLFEACRQQHNLKAIVAITSDKCYENQEWPWGYRENDRLGGHDPYSASKAAAELVAASYRSAFFNKASLPLLLATARAGNVIGGGDWAEDRLIPDLIRAHDQLHPLEIRSPLASRPWQHVLESLSGYLLLGQKLLQGDKAFAAAWNFGPGAEDNRTVVDILEKMRQHWPSLNWHLTSAPQPQESTRLHLDSTKARSLLGWHPVWNLDTTLAKTSDWYRAWLESKEVISCEQLEAYITDASRVGNVWAAQ